MLGGGGSTELSRQETGSYQCGVRCSFTLPKDTLVQRRGGKKKKKKKRTVNSFIVSSPYIKHRDIQTHAPALHASHVSADEQDSRDDQLQ